MKRLPLLFVLAITCCTLIAAQYIFVGYNSGPASGGMWTINQNAVTCSGSTGYTCTIITGTANRTIEVDWVVESGTAHDVSSITDNASGGSNTYANVGGSAYQCHDNSAGQGEIWYALESNAGATTITVNFTGGGTGFSVVREISGIKTSSPVDATNTVNLQGSSTTPNGAAVTTTVSGDYISSILLPQNSISGINSGNEFTNDSTFGGGVGWAHITSTSATAASHQAVWASSGSGTFCSITAAFFHN